MRMCFFGCISLARVFILRVSEFSLSSYRSSQYFLAVDFIILRESFSINFFFMFFFCCKAVDSLIHGTYVSHVDGQVTGVKPAMSPLTSISNQASSSLHQDPLGSSSSLGPQQRDSLTPSNNMDSLCDKLSKHEYEDIDEVDYFFDTVNVKGRLKDHIQFGVNIQAPEFILSIISEGYKLPLLHTPPRSVTKNNLSAINNSVFVTESILDLLASDRISEFSKDNLHVINPLSVSTQSSGKRRLILDLRFVNQFILKQKVKFEDYKTALDLFQYGGYACSFDLKSGYHHVDIFPSHQRFLGFSWAFPDGMMEGLDILLIPFYLSVFLRLLISLLN